MANHRKKPLPPKEKAFTRAKKVGERNAEIIRRRSYLLVLWQLRVAGMLLRCAEEPGPDRITCLWCASGRLANARRIAKSRHINLSKRITKLDVKYARLDLSAGACEAIGELKMVSGCWHERSVWVH